MWRILIGLFLLSSLSPTHARADSLDQLASDFWTWRAQYRPFTFDDVPRMEHAAGTRDWSAAAIAQQRADLADIRASMESHAHGRLAGCAIGGLPADGLRHRARPLGIGCKSALAARPCVLRRADRRRAAGGTACLRRPSATTRSREIVARSGKYPLHSGTSQAQSEGGCTVRAD